MKVSVVLPVYNVGPYLEEALDSLCQQTLSDFEIIAVNDGSTDNSLEILERYMVIDKRIRCYTQENKGLSSARNTGLSFCTGEYIYFMDSDDIINAETLQTCYETAKDKHADLCIFDAEIFYEENAKKLEWDYDRSNLLVKDKKYCGEELLDILISHWKHKAVVSAFCPCSRR